MIGSRRRGNIGLNSKDNAGEVVHAVPGEKLRTLVTNDYPNLFPHQLFSMSAPPHTKPLWTWPVATREGAKGETGTAGHTPCDGKEETEWRRSKGGAFKSVAKYFPERRLGTRVKSKASAKSRRRPRAGRCRTAPPRTQALMPGACVGSGVLQIVPSHFTRPLRPRAAFQAVAVVAIVRRVAACAAYLGIIRPVRMALAYPADAPANRAVVIRCRS
jgi:hypothetical protein